MKNKHHLNKMFKLPHIWRVACHTDNIGPGSTFVAISGATLDGVTFIVQAIKKGAVRIVIHDDVILPHNILAELKKNNVELMRVADTRLALAQLSAQAYECPAQRLKLIGITGTKGKTTTAFLTHHMLQEAGLKTALLSTVENRIGDIGFKSPLTTAQPDYLHMFFDQCVQRNITHVVMEVAAQALTLHRVHGLQFVIGAFTNFAHEHLEFYDSMDDYFQAKVALLDHLTLNAPFLVNVDDAALQGISYAHCVPVSVKTTKVHQYAPEIVADLAVDDCVQRLQAPFLMGEFNVYNILFAVHIAWHFSVALDVIQRALSHFDGVPGRLQKHVMPNGAVCFIDYAHTPDSYKHVLKLLRSLTDNLIVVFGCGGMRDKTKRPIMGSVAAYFADKIIVTNDNPRNEEPMAIVDDIKRGILPHDMNKVTVVLDRAQAIEKAYGCSKKDSIIAVLGKGPDAYQEIGIKRYAYSDTSVVNALNEKKV